MTLVRQQHPSAFGELYRRHQREAHRYARLLAYRHLRQDAAEDLVAEAVRKVLSALANGRGPRQGFRPYLITTIRNVVFSQSTRSINEPAAEDSDHLFEPAIDESVDGYVAVAALASLTVRWQRVLWLTEAMKLAPAEVAARLGTAPSGVPMMAMRAREALRVAYIRQHLPSAASRSCSRALDLLARRPVAAISSRQATLLDDHLATCDTCRHAAAQIDDEIGRWPRSLPPASLPDGSLDGGANAMDEPA